MNNIDNFFTENTVNSGAGACSYNELTIPTNAGNGHGSPYDSINFNKGNGSKTGAIIISDIINAGCGSGTAKGNNIFFVSP